jgi:hypothetical protein
MNRCDPKWDGVTYADIKSVNVGMNRFMNTPQEPHYSMEQTMKATLRRDTVTTYLDLPSQRAFPKYIAFGSALYETDSVTSGDYKYVGNVHIVGRDAGEVTGEESNPVGNG